MLFHNSLEDFVPLKISFVFLCVVNWSFLKQMLAFSSYILMKPTNGEVINTEQV